MPCRRDGGQWKVDAIMLGRARALQWPALAATLLVAAGAAFIADRHWAGGDEGEVPTAANPLPVTPAREAAPTAVGVPWVADDGTAFAVMVEGADLRAFLAARAERLSAEADRISAEMEGLAGAGSKSVFVPLIERVPKFTDWVYGWVESYFAAYLIAERAVERLVLGDEQGKSVGAGAAIEGALRAVVSEKFEQIVVRPVGPEDQLARNRERLGRSVANEWQALLERDRQHWDEFLFARSQAGRPLDDGDANLTICAIVPELTGLPDGEQGLSRQLAPEQADLFAMRFARPFAARISVLGLRLAGVGPTFGAAGAIGAGLGAAGSFAVAWTVATATIWTVDYMINWIDGALYRAEFEALLVGALAEAEAREAHESGAGASRAITVALAHLARGGARRVFPVKPPPSGRRGWRGLVSGSIRGCG